METIAKHGQKRNDRKGNEVTNKYEVTTRSMGWKLFPEVSTHWLKRGRSKKIIFSILSVNIYTTVNI